MAAQDLLDPREQCVLHPGLQAGQEELCQLLGLHLQPWVASGRNILALQKVLKKERPCTICASRGAWLTARL